MITTGANNSSNTAGSAHLGVSLPSGKGGEETALGGSDLFVNQEEERGK